MRIYNTTTETCKVYSHNVRGKCIKFLAIAGIFWNFGGGLKLQGITKKFHLYISGKIYLVMVSARNLKKNEKSKYKSVPFFSLFLAIERKP